MIRRIGWALVAVIFSLGIICDIQRADDRIEAAELRELATMQQGGAQ